MKTWESISRRRRRCHNSSVSFISFLIEANYTNVDKNRRRHRVHTAFLLDTVVTRSLFDTQTLKQNFL